MFRMLLDSDAIWRPAAPKQGVMRPLAVDDAPAVEALIAPTLGTPGEIDAFAPSQMADGTFFGAYMDDDLVGVAGTHIVSDA